MQDSLDQGATIEQESKEDQILHELDFDSGDKKNLGDTHMKNKNLKVLIFFSVLAILAGVGTGFGAFRLQASKEAVDLTSLEQVAKEGQIQPGDVFGIKDDKTFADSAEGYLDEGNPDMEGSHQLVRPGGVSQTVYLTSSVTDLDKFVGMQVRVKGETFKGQKAGWLMDVGQVEVLELNATPPEEE